MQTVIQEYYGCMSRLQPVSPNLSEERKAFREADRIVARARFEELRDLPEIKEHHRVLGHNSAMWNNTHSSKRLNAARRRNMKRGQRMWRQILLGRKKAAKKNVGA